MSEIHAQRGYAEVAGTRLYYELAGAGPALVLIHGFAVDARVWDAQFETLAATHRVLRYDLRGFGRSAAPGTAPYSHTGDLHALMQHLRIDPAVIVGLSMGGWIATHFVLTHPEATRALVLIDAVLIGAEWSPEWKSRWGEIKTLAVQSGIEAAKRRWLEHPIFALAHMNEELSAQLARMVADYSGWHWVNPDPHEPIEPPDIKRLHKIAVPTLIVTGEYDMRDFHANAQLFQQRIHHARAVVIASVGHLPNFEAATTFNRHLREFLAGL